MGNYHPPTTPPSPEGKGAESWGLGDALAAMAAAGSTLPPFSEPRGPHISPSHAPLPAVSQKPKHHQRSCHHRERQNTTNIWKPGSGRCCRASPGATGRATPWWLRGTGGSAQGRTGDAPAIPGKQPTHGVTRRAVQQILQRSLLLQAGLLLSVWLKTRSHPPGEFDAVSKWMRCCPPQDQYRFISLKTRGIKQVTASAVPEAGLEGVPQPIPSSISIQGFQGASASPEPPAAFPSTSGPCRPPGRRLQHAPSPLSPWWSPRQAQLRLRSTWPPDTLASVHPGRSLSPSLKPPSTTVETCCWQLFFV